MGNLSASTRFSSRLRVFRDWLRPMCFGHEMRVLIVGIDAAGKTTLLYRLKLGETIQTIPTVGFNVETFTHGGVTFTAWEFGGGDRTRPLWSHYYQNTRAVILVVDSADRARLHESRDAIHRMLQNPEVQRAPLLVLANKQDLDGAMTAEQVEAGLELAKVNTGAATVLPVVVTEGTGLMEALDWLVVQLKPAAGTTATPRGVA